jgi:hypothetical protein
MRSEGQNWEGKAFSMLVSEVALQHQLGRCGPEHQNQPFLLLGGKQGTARFLEKMDNR